MSTQLTEPPPDTVIPAAEPDLARGTAATGLSGSPPRPSATPPSTPAVGAGHGPRRLAAGLLVLGLAVSSGTAGAYAATRLEGNTTTTSSTATASSLASVAAAVKPSVVTVIVRSAGQVVGITTANASVSGQSSGSIGIGFAIPIDHAKQVIDQLMNGSYAVHRIGTSGPHHVFVSKDFTVTGAA